MERLLGFNEEQDLTREFFSESVYSCGNNERITRMVTTEIFSSDEGGFKIARATVILASGEVKKLIEPIVKLPCPVWIDARGRDASWAESAWVYLSEGLSYVKHFIGDLEKPDFGVFDNVCPFEIARRSVLATPNFSENLRVFMGVSDSLEGIKSVTRSGCFYDDGNFREFPELIVRLPFPKWVNAVSFEIGDMPSLQPVWMFRSQAENEAIGMIRKLETFQKL